MQPSAAAAERRQDAAAPDAAADVAATTEMSDRAPRDAGAAGSGGAPAASAAGSAAIAAANPVAKPAAQDAGQTQKSEPKPDDQGMKPPAQDAGQPEKPEVKPPAPMSPQPAADAAVPAKPTHCKPGVYTGTFSGMIQLLGLTFSSVNGTVRAQLKPAVPDRLDIVDGKVFGVDPDGNRLTVELYGSVNCATDVLEDGRLERGIFHNSAANSDTPFVGTVNAVYSTEPHSLVGTFVVQANDVSLLTGKGTWSVIAGQ